MLGRLNLKKEQIQLLLFLLSRVFVLLVKLNFAAAISGYARKEPRAVLKDYGAFASVRLEDLERFAAMMDWIMTAMDWLIARMVIAGIMLPAKLMLITLLMLIRMDCLTAGRKNILMM